MCLIFLALNSHPQYPLIVAANRDEFHERPTGHAHFWKQHPNLLAGTDLQAGGTWLGVTRSGRFAAITNYRDGTQPNGKQSRGKIVSDFLASQESTGDFSNKLAKNGNDYAGFNCLFGQLPESSDLHYYANHSQQHMQLSKGIHGLSNADIDTPWHKVSEGKKAITELLNHTFNEEEWFAMLGNQSKADSENLPDTGIDKELELLLSSRFIQSENYGTRSSTLITLSINRQLKFIERSYNSEGKATATRGFQFQLQP